MTTREPQSAPGFEKHPGYRVEIKPTTDRVRILFGDTTLADTRRALKVLESRYHPVWYVPLADVDTELLDPTDHSTYCPFKGHASYWTIRSADGPLENSVWAYQDPYRECLPLKDHVAFYPDRVTLEINGEVQDPRGPGWTG